MDCTVHGVTKSWTRLSDFHFHFSLCSTEFVLMSVLCYFDHCSFEVCFGIRTYETSNFVFSSRLLCSFAVPWNSVWISGWIFLFLKEKYYLEILTRTLNLFRYWHLNNLSHNPWKWDVFPIIWFPLIMFGSFQCTSFSPPWLRLFLSILFFLCNRKCKIWGGECSLLIYTNTTDFCVLVLSCNLISLWKC